MHALNPFFAPANAEDAPRVAVIAEIGVNHDGDPARAVALTHAAAHAGADAVKLQLFHPDRLLSDDAELADYQQGKAQSAQELLAGLMLSVDAMAEVRDTARALGLAFIVTPFSPEDVDDLATLDVDAVKTASPDAVNHLLLNRACSLGKPMLVSTGTCSAEELDDTVGLLKQHATQWTLLHCVSAYPTPLDHAALNGIVALAQRYDQPAGYSDHTAALHTGALAVASGAVVLEKHLTYDRAAPGPDHAASLDPQGLAEYIQHVREAQRMLGPIRKSPGSLEADVRRVSRQSLCLARDVKMSKVLEWKDLTTKRPGTGILAREAGMIIGHKASRDLPRGRMLKRDDWV